MNRQTLAAIGLAGGLLLWGAYVFFQPTASSRSYHARELATSQMARHLNSIYPAGKVLVLANPFVQSSKTDPAIQKTEQAGIQGLQQVFGSRLEVIYPELKSGARENPYSLMRDIEISTPLSVLVDSESLGRQLAQRPRGALVISLIGVPAGWGQWTASLDHKWAFLFPDFRRLVSPPELEASMNSGKIAAFVLRKPGGLADGMPMGKSAESEFEQRFLLVTASNLLQVIRNQPALF